MSDAPLDVPALQRLLDRAAENCVTAAERATRAGAHAIAKAAYADAEQLGVVSRCLPGLVQDGARLDWLDTLPCGIVILADANFTQSMGRTPKGREESHTRTLIDECRAARSPERAPADPSET